jgi:hypothetical protein
MLIGLARPIIANHPYFVVIGEIGNSSDEVEFPPNGCRMISIPVCCVEEDQGLDLQHGDEPGDRKASIVAILPTKAEEAVYNEEDADWVLKLSRSRQDPRDIRP